MKTVIPRKMGRPPALTMRQKKFAKLYVFDRGKVIGYYKNENINTNVNIEIDGMSKEDLVKEFDSFYKEKMKDVTPTKASIKSKEELNPDTDSE